MPELPEVETIRRGLAPYLETATITQVTLSRPDLRFAFPARFAARLEGRRIETAGRRAKYLLFALSDGAIWLSHLGMTGTFSIAGLPGPEPSRRDPVPAASRHVHVRIGLDHPGHGPLTLTYADPRRFGFMDLFAAGAANRFTDPLGPEALGNGFHADHLIFRFKGKSAPVKAALLDQRVVAGLGNIYVLEALHRAAISPLRPAGGLDADECARLADAVVTVLGAAIAAGGSTLSDFRNAQGTPGYFQHTFLVYGKAGSPCPRPDCDGTVARIAQSGRSSFYCPVCQR